jgi:hypothetical protein
MPFFYCWHCERKNIDGPIRNWIRNFKLVREDPDPKLGQDPNPDPKKIVSAPQHCGKQITSKTKQLQAKSVSDPDPHSFFDG